MMNNFDNNETNNMNLTDHRLTPLERQTLANNIYFTNLLNEESTGSSLFTIAAMIIALVVTFIACNC